MKLHQKIPFNHEGKDYEIRVLHDEQKINIVVFSGNYPITGIRHHLMIPKQHDRKRIIKSKVLKEFIEISKSDILEKRWERLLSN
jgi:hypothetical protein